MKRAAFAAFAFLLCLGSAAKPAPPQPVDVALLLEAIPAPTLDRYRLFADASAHVPNAGMTPYGVNTPLFSDYAEKFRYLYLPPGKAVAYRADGVLDIPLGAALVKTFAYPADFREPTAQVRFIETRLLIHKVSGWVALTYVWNAAQDQAVLNRAGAHIDVAFSDADGAAQRIDYHVPNVNQCKQCHSSDNALIPIGPKARNLNGTYPYAEGAENQLAHWTRLGLLTGGPDPAMAPRLPRWDDAGEPLAARARAYLDVNCAHCHNRAGLASNSGLYLGYDETNPSVLGINKRPVAAGIGSGGLSFSIAPGHPEQSILVFRMQSTDPGAMMPQIGRTMSDRQAVKLISDYIASMPP